ncbi:HD-GYP domain-containing protein [Thalassolituus alkanivorans]|uniref:HD-GYP domain-containing protein n=1 Tax=Thalassolituus alkanivorans TaxID=2881055 RepID=UPI001E3FB985|nr:HD-GYP domain-containing protein [Thalassolituus alkanivorans]MCB2387261.1 HD-GYP domain-containing protein [Thalassolituus alkanivorans]MCB2421557.1 HD-GYP domain-containing protein [Thalassolituus alkanivorans]
MIGSITTTRNGRKFQINKRHTRKRMDVSELTAGMYIVELDRPWTESPFLFQGFLLENDDDLLLIQTLCKWVFVDVVEEEWNELDEKGKSAPQKRTRYVEKQEMAQQLSAANRTYQATKLQIKRLLASAQLGQAFNLQEAQRAVKDCVERVVNNPNAILWLTRLKHQDEYTAEHSVNVCLLSIALGKQMDLAPYELENLGICGLMHDIGKMKVPTEILNKPGPLDPEEFAEMARHTLYAKQLLMGRSDIYPGAVDVAYSHHERLDGKGYPRGIDSTKLSLFTRIVTVADAYDAMTSDRCYKPGMSSLDAMRILNRNRGTQFDEELVRKFISMIGLYPPGYLLEMSNGEVGIILSADPGYQLKPKVIMILGPDKQPQPERIVNLSMAPADDFGVPYQPQGVFRSGCFGVHVSDYINRGLRIKGFEYAMTGD